MLKVVQQHPIPVIARDHPDAAAIRYGFEGGTVVRVGDTLHLFISELAGDPAIVKMRLGHWTSTDRIAWQRAGTLFESSGECAGMDDRAALWSPNAVYDEQEGVWNVFYVAYRSMPPERGIWLWNFDGKIWRAVSTCPGRDGVNGPYRDAGIILRAMPTQDAWEGLQGTDSFYPFRVDDRWYAFYGSARMAVCPGPVTFWGVGLATASKLSGPWRRLSELNPVPLAERFIENPIVHRFADGVYGCVADSKLGRGFGYAESADGIHWDKATLVPLREDGWLRHSRTPLGLVPRDDGRFDVFFTAHTTDTRYQDGNFGAVGWAIVERETIGKTDP